MASTNRRRNGYTTVDKLCRNSCIIGKIDTHQRPSTEQIVSRRLATLRTQLNTRLTDAFLEDYTPQEVSFSFSLGIFITALPTFGTGVLVFFALAYLFERLSKIALFASVIVLNPVVKWGVYGASFWIGQAILGPVPGGTVQDFSLSLDMGIGVIYRLWLGNLILAMIFSVVAYAVGLRLITKMQSQHMSTQERSAGG